MKKVVYTVTRVGKYGNSKMTGFGFINETDLIALYKGADGKRHRRVYEDCLKTCYKTNKPNEYKGSFYEIRECEFEKNGSYETREIEVNYYIWYKLVD